VVLASSTLFHGQRIPGALESVVLRDATSDAAVTVVRPDVDRRHEATASR
jgi:hypothetical protein